MKFGLSIHGRELKEQPADDAFHNLVRQVRAADAAGFDLIIVGHHYLISEHHKFQPVPTLGRLASESDRMYFGSSLLLPLHHPVVIAEQYATLDAITGGRTLICPMAGYRDIEFDSLGISKGERGSRLTEGCELIKRLWTEDNVTFEGEHFTVEDASINPKPLQSPRPPIWIGANKDRAVSRATEIGDAWYINPHEDLATVRRQLDLVDTPTGNGFHGLQPIRKYAFVAPTDEEANEIYGPYMDEKFDWYRRAGQADASENPDAFDKKFEQLKQGRFLIGSPTTVVDGIKRLKAELDIGCIVLSFNFPGIDYDAVIQSIELTGEEVIPRLRDL